MDAEQALVGARPAPARPALPPSVQRCLPAAPEPTSLGTFFCWRAAWKRGLAEGTEVSVCPGKAPPSQLAVARERWAWVPEPVTLPPCAPSAGLCRGQRPAPLGAQ